MKSLLLSMMVLLVSTSAMAYDQTISTWETTTVQGKLKDQDNKATPISYYLELQPHVFFKPFPTLDTFENWGALNQSLDYNLSLGAGGGWVSSFKDLKFIPVNEVRAFEQFAYAPTVESFSFNLRARLEERFFLAKDGSLRLRLLTKAAYAFNDYVSLVVFNELFVANSFTKVDTKFDQDRLFAGIRLKPNKNFAVEIGYQPVFKITDIEHVVMVNTVFYID